MKSLVKLIVLLAIGAAAYLYFVPGASVDDFSKYFSQALSLIPGRSEAQELPPAPAGKPRTSAQPAGATTSAVDLPTPTPRPLEVIRLKNGKSIVGNIVVRDPEITMIRGVDGKTVQVNTKDIVTQKP